MTATQFDRDFDKWMQDPVFAIAYSATRARLDGGDPVTEPIPDTVERIDVVEDDEEPAPKNDPVPPTADDPAQEGDAA